MKLCIAEKPSVAKEIATILGCKELHKGYLQGANYYVSWTFGHLCTLKEPHDYNPVLKSWRMDALPILPQPFGIKLINDKGVEAQFRVIEQLMAKVDEVINCGDAGQEGELIQRWVMQMAGCRVKVSRLWISSLTEEAIREGFNTLHPASDYDLLYQAGMSRAIGDWLLGMNATRSYTIRYSRGKGQVLSIGRVQTPTLNMIVERCREIQNFKPEFYWELKTVYRDTTFSCTKGKFKNPDEANALVEVIRQNPLTITNVTEKKGKEQAPRLFDLTSLQVECNKKFSFSADQTLKIIQSLYEKKVATYPRVDTTYLPDDMYPKIGPIIKNLSTAYIVEEPLRPELSALTGTKLPKSKKIFDNSKVTDHHAIIPTGMVNASLTRDEHRVFNLIVRHFAANFMDDCLVATTTVLAEVPANGKPLEFKVTGKVIVKPGWRVLFKVETKEEREREAQKEVPTGVIQQEEPEQTLPVFVKGESGLHEPKTVQKQTNPPKYFTEATLLRAMETAGKSAENEEIREAMKENGIGRPSTRAAIIETLLKRSYVVKERKSLLATQTGCQLIDTIRDPQIKSPELTGQWEHKLRLIERGEYSAAQFIGELKQMATSVVNNVRNDTSGMTIVATTPLAKELRKKAVSRQRKPQIVEGQACPLCGKGIIIRGNTQFGCSRWREGCNFRAPFPKEKETQ
ncbi:MAG: DNA topoisomerase 3 [Paludibacteraceae bacterium]|nr:DNA topoisomerase 3 [Paludibacteraceae bacterium]